MNHTNTITPRWCLLTALFAMALTVAVPPAAIAQKKKTDLPPQKSATALTSITTTEGKTYDAVEITKVNPDSISFVHSAGVATVAFTKLPPDVQRRFNYVPKPAVPPASASPKPEVAGSGLTIEQIASKANNPQDFVGALIGDAKRFPFTAFTYALKAKDWLAATSLATSEAETIKERIKLVEVFSLSPLEYVVMAQAESGDFNGANQTCNKIPSIPEQARARRMIITRLAANGDFKGADVNLAIFELRDAQRLPKDDRDKMKKRDYESMSEDGRMLALEYWRSTRLIIQGLAAKGKIQEAMRYIEGVDGDEKILAVVSVAEAKAEFGDADALTFGREGASHYKKSFPPARFWIVEAQARGFSKAGQRSLALELIANALADAPKDDEKAHLLKVRAELHRDSGDKFAAKQDIIEALAALDQNADSKVLRSALVIAPEEVKAWSKDLRGKLLQRLTQQVTDDDRDKIIMALKDLAGSLSYAGEHEDSRVTMNEAFKVLKNLDSKFRGIAAHGYCMRMLLRGEIGNVEEALALVTEKRDIRRLSEKLAYIRAKQQKLGEARATLNGELLSAEGVDLLGAGFVGWEDIVKRIFNAEPFSK